MRPNHDPRHPASHPPETQALPRRGTDLAESVLGWTSGICAVVLLFLAVAAALLTRADGAARAEQDARDHVPVTATLRQAVETPVAVDPYSAPATQTAPADWRAPDGSPRSGVIPVYGLQQAGAQVQVWVDRSGTPTAPPMVPGQATVAAVGVGLLVLVGGGALLLAAHAFARSRIEARIAAAWAAEWERVEPLWSGRA